MKARSISVSLLKHMNAPHRASVDVGQIFAIYASRVTDKSRS
jgi:hypothetical protein